MRKAGKAKVYTASAVLYVHRPKPKKKKRRVKNRKFKLSREGLFARSSREAENSRADVREDVAGLLSIIEWLSVIIGVV
jgi:hypothetical protein